MADGPDSAGRAPGPVLGRLHRQPPLAGLLLDRSATTTKPFSPSNALTSLPLCPIRGLSCRCQPSNRGINSEASDRVRGPESASHQRTNPHASSRREAPIHLLEVRPRRAIVFNCTESQVLADHGGADNKYRSRRRCPRRSRLNGGGTPAELRCARSSHPTWNATACITHGAEPTDAVAA